MLVGMVLVGQAVVGMLKHTCSKLAAVGVVAGLPPAAAAAAAMIPVTLSSQSTVVLSCLLPLLDKVVQEELHSAGMQQQQMQVSCIVLDCLWHHAATADFTSTFTRNSIHLMRWFINSLESASKQTCTTGCWGRVYCPQMHSTAAVMSSRFRKI
jgi:hypothetical protein